MAGAELSPDGARVVGADRVLAVLIELGDHPQGATLDELSLALNSPKSTVHRALMSLRRAGLATLVRRASTCSATNSSASPSNFAERPDGLRITPMLESLRADMARPPTMRSRRRGGHLPREGGSSRGGGPAHLFIGGRNPAAEPRSAKSARWLPVPARPSCVGSIGGGSPVADAAHHHLCERTVDANCRERERGYGIDDQENELGINCVAVPVRLDQTPRSGRCGERQLSGVPVAADRPGGRGAGDPRDDRPWLGRDKTTEDQYVARPPLMS